MDIPEMIVTGIAVGIALGTNIAQPLKTGWTGQNPVDDSIRSALRVPNIDTQLEVRSASDLGLALMTTYPVVVDSLIVAYWYRGSADVALQMALMDGEAFAITAALQGTANFFSGRIRPYQADCGNGLGDTTACATNTLNRSFFSGHSSVAFTAAALICSHHEALRLFDSPADHFACAAGLLAATAVGAMRIIGDAHYFSDVFIGAVVGTTVGLTIPLLHHYRHASTPTKSAFRLNLVPGIGSAQLMGTF